MKKGVVFYMLLGAALALTGCAEETAVREEAEELLEPAGASASTVRVQRKDLIDAEYDTGYVLPMTYSLSFEIDGTVSYCELRPGDQVKKHQELAVLDDQELEAALSELDEEYEKRSQQYALLNEQWEQETARQREKLAALAMDTQEAELLQLSLDERILAHEEELEEQEQALAAILAQYDEKNASSTRNRILSPCDGIVMSVEIQTGDSVSAGSCAVVIGDYSAGYIACDTFYYETHIEELVSMTGYLGAQAFPVGYLAYTQEELQSAAENGNVNLPGRFSLDMEQTGAQIGDFVALQLVNTLAEDALCVRRDALYSDSDGYYVYKIEEGVRRRVDVRTGLDNGMEVEILEGDLQEGDEVYVQE